MSKKKKPKKAAGKVTAPPPAAVDQGDTAPVAPANAGIESDGAPAPRRSVEADSEGGDVERLDE